MALRSGRALRGSRATANLASATCNMSFAGCVVAAFSLNLLRVTQRSSCPQPIGSTKRRSRTIREWRPIAAPAKNHSREFRSQPFRGSRYQIVTWCNHCTWWNHCTPLGATIAPDSRNDSRSTTLPNPPFQGGDFVLGSTSKEKTARARELTVRERRHLNEHIYESMRDPRVDFSSAVETACARLVIPLNDAWAALSASGIDPPHKFTRRDEADA
jgi:hypothetical protein